MLSFCFLDFSVHVGAFVIGLSQISSFFSVCVLNSNAIFQDSECVLMYNRPKMTKKLLSFQVELRI